MMHDDSRDPLILDVLGRVVPQFAPADSLRARVLSAATPAVSSFEGRRSVRTPATAWRWLAAAAAVLLMLTAGAWWSARREVTRLQATIAQFQAGDRDGITDILSASDVRGVPLQGLPPAAAAAARVFVSPSRGLMMAAEGLPALPAGQVYQLWAIIGTTPISAGVFQRDTNGRATVLHHAPIASPAALAVTVEPAGGVSAPTGPKYLLGSASN